MQKYCVNINTSFASRFRQEFKSLYTVSYSYQKKYLIIIADKKEKQADFYARENSRNEQKTSECSGEIMRLKHKLRSRSFLINSVDGFCSLQRQRAEALMLSSFPNFDSPERPTG